MKEKLANQKVEAFKKESEKKAAEKEADAEAIVEEVKTKKVVEEINTTDNQTINEAEEENLPEADTEEKE